ncbi:hypothetical protein [Mesorhizobium sp.]|uniref:hypothetical protein n=1 Tax=Mesorhizobium sp. TaxID=1871066 RepID=UPI0025FFF041|nr:hypothetical protein [Mesorhizobium sp.]
MRRIIVRFAVILVGYLVASLAASVFVYVLMLARHNCQSAWPEPPAAAVHLFLVLFGALLAARIFFVPAALVILMGEIFGWRSWLFYALGGAVIGFLTMALTPEAAAYVETSVRLKMTGAGMVGGIFYWLSAGRWAGSWRRETLLDSEP